MQFPNNFTTSIFHYVSKRMPGIKVLCLETVLMSQICSNKMWVSFSWGKIHELKNYT